MTQDNINVKKRSHAVSIIPNTDHVHEDGNNIKGGGCFSDSLHRNEMHSYSGLARLCQDRSTPDNDHSLFPPLVLSLVPGTLIVSKSSLSNNLAKVPATTAWSSAVSP